VRVFVSSISTLGISLRCKYRDDSSLVLVSIVALPRRSHFHSIDVKIEEWPITDLPTDLSLKIKLK
jgi:hypothetical protein